MSDNTALTTAEAGIHAVVPVVARARPRLRRLHIGDLPKPVLCVPLVVQWMWLSLLHRSLTLPSACDPCIETGGLAGESKAECLGQIGAPFAGSVAGWAPVRPGEPAEAVRLAAGLDYPLIVKPDIGWCGFGVRRVVDPAGLAAYQAVFPAGATFLLQRYVPGPGEAGLFYVRVPGEDAGRVTGITLRHPPHVEADGVRTIAELLALGRPAGAPGPGLPDAELALVPPAGRIVPLSAVASVRVGGRYRDATARLTPALEARVDAIARSMPEFHAGRFDVRFASQAGLLRGEFTIIEVNGAGSEAIHLWDDDLPFVAAFLGVFAKQSLLFRIGAMMRSRGHRPVGPVALARAWLKQQRLIAQYPASN